MRNTDIADGDLPQQSSTESARPPIRSYSRRQGRITSAQKTALQSLWPEYGINPTTPLDLAGIFANPTPLVVEIGFGDGENIAQSALQHPDLNFIGVEVHKPGIGRLLMKAGELRLNNIRIFHGDAVGFLSECIPPSSVHRINLYFPDPWPKKRHHKRRILTPEFVSSICSALENGGYFHCATDWANYAVSMQETLEASELVNVETLSGADRNPLPARIRTKFEKRGLRLGHQVRDLIYQKL